ncbi:MAG: tRNA lysidine(34) synthetase TilS [Sulfuricurvum sp.]
MQLSQKSFDLLRGAKNLLAFSGGVDSSALFFLLSESGVEFDIAIVDYGVREASRDELSYAKELASRFTLACHTLEAPHIEANFEAEARRIRYEFFEELIAKHNYKNLITAHHLGDQLEWFLMQLSKGAGVFELAGMSEVEQRGSFRVVRPLLGVQKSELVEFLHSIDEKYFVDESNFGDKYRRNYFRHAISDPLLERYGEGIKRSLEYIREDLDLFSLPEFRLLGELGVAKSSTDARLDEVAIDRHLKKRGYLMSRGERARLRDESSVEVGRRFVVVKSGGFLYVVPRVDPKPLLSREFKELCRTRAIHKDLRGYLFLNQDLLELL